MFKALAHEDATLGMLADLSLLLSGDWGRWLSTGVVLTGCYLLIRGSRSWVAHSEPDGSPHVKRGRIVWLRNFFWILGAVAIGAIWASKIAGLVLSITALVAALLIVNKELILCQVGYALLVLTKPYQVGDHIEIGAFSGRVLDISLFGTSLAETTSGKQSTGKTLLFPNNLLLTLPVKNLSVTNPYVVAWVHFVFPLSVDLAQAESTALSVAMEETEPWRVAAGSHLEELEKRFHWDLPSSTPKVFWEQPDSKVLQLHLRVVVPAEKQVHVSQAIFKRFWQAYKETMGPISLPSPEQP